MYVLAKIVTLQKPHCKKSENIPLTIQVIVGVTNIIQDSKVCILGYEKILVNVFFGIKFGVGFICLGDYLCTCLMHSALNLNAIFTAVILIRYRVI